MLSKEELDAYSKEFYTPIFKYCMKKLSNVTDAEDATQETFAVFSEKGYMLNSEHIQTWLITTAHHMVLKEYQRRYRKKDKECVYDEELLELSRKVRTFEEDLVDYYIERHINEIYERLSDREKEVFDLYSDGTMKTGEIAQLLGIDPHACSMRKKRLEAKCRDIMMEILFY